MPDVSRSQLARLDHVCKAFMSEAMGRSRRGRRSGKKSSRSLPKIAAMMQPEAMLPSISTSSLDEESGLYGLHTIQYDGIQSQTQPGSGRFPPLSLPSTWMLLSLEADKMMQSTSSSFGGKKRMRRPAKRTAKAQPSPKATASRNSEGEDDPRPGSSESAEQRRHVHGVTDGARSPEVEVRVSQGRATVIGLPRGLPALTVEGAEERQNTRPLSASTDTLPLSPYSYGGETPRQVRVGTSGDGISTVSGPVLEKGYTRRYQTTRSFDKASVMAQSEMGETEFEEVGQEIFDKVKDHNEVHRTELGRALELLGFVCPHQAWIDEIFSRISPQYNTIEIDDFVTFLREYAAFRDEAYEASFRRCDQDGSGQIDSSELAEMLEELDVQPMSHVLEEVIEEVDKDQGGTLDLDEFKELLDLLHMREGFTRSEFEEFVSILRRYDRRKGQVDGKDLPAILNWLGFMWPKERIQQVLDQVNSGTRLDPHNFIVCMRKVREHELEMVQHLLRKHDSDNSGTIGMREVVPILKEIGYEMWDISAIFEAAEEAGVDSSEMDLSGLWRLLLTYRKREGFANIDLQQIDGAFDKDRVQSLPALEAMRALRELGFTANFLVMQTMLSKVDVDDTGSLDKREFRKMVRMLQERETLNYKKAFQAALPEGAKGLKEQEAAQAIRDLSFRVNKQYLALAAAVCAKSNREDEPFLDQMAFVRVCSYHSRDLREVYKSNGGWTEGEVNNLQSVFNRYDVKHSGLIASKELVRMVTDLFPILARDRKMRPELQRIMKEVLQETWSFQGLGFKDFLRLMQLFREFQDRERAKKETEAIEATGFNSSEVAQFRDFFLAANPSHHGSAPVELSFDQFWKMINDITPLGDSLTVRLKEIFHEFTQKMPGAVRSKQRAEDADFPEFLLMMKHLLESNFAKIQDKTRATRS